MLQASSKFFSATLKSQGGYRPQMDASRSPNLTWEASRDNERYGSDMLFEILSQAKKKEVEKMLAENPHDPLLDLCFNGHKNVQRLDGTYDETIQGAETKQFSTLTLKNIFTIKPK